MITSALIAECRREYQDPLISVRVSRNGDGTANLFNVGKFPIIENSYVIKKSGSALIENGVSGYTINLDNGDIALTNIPANGVPIQADLQYAEWRDKNWLEAINSAIQDLNGRGFFRQVTRATSIFRISAGIQKYNAPSACVDLYGLLISPNGLSGTFVQPQVNWSYQQDANTVILGNPPTSSMYAAISYLRNLQTYAATSATLDTINEWNAVIKVKAGARFYRSLAAKIAKQGNATVDEGHFSFTNLRTMANDLDNEFDNFAKRKKPTRPAKDFQWHVDGGGTA